MFQTLDNLEFTDSVASILHTGTAYDIVDDYSHSSAATVTFPQRNLYRRSANYRFAVAYIGFHCRVSFSATITCYRL